MVDRFERFSFLISEISHYRHKIAASVMEGYALKGQYAVYFTALSQKEDGITAADLSEMCARDKADVSRSLSDMEKRGLIVRQSNKNPYRAKVKLTNEGILLSKHINEKVMQAVEFVGKDLKDSEREIFYSCLEKINSNLQALSREGL